MTDKRKNSDLGSNEYIRPLDPNNITTFSNRFCFIEFPNMILIESEEIGLWYYFNKLPVYDFNGNIINIHLNNNCDILDIDIEFTKMIGLPNYLNPNPDKQIKITNLEDVVKNINDLALIILYNHIVINHINKVNRYNLSTELILLIKKIDSIGISREKLIDIYKKMIDIPEHTHNNDPTNDIYNVYITPYSDYKLILTDKNYKNPPPRLPGEPIIFIKNKIISCNSL